MVVIVSLKKKCVQTAGILKSSIDDIQVVFSGFVMCGHFSGSNDSEYSVSRLSAVNIFDTASVVTGAL